MLCLGTFAVYLISGAQAAVEVAEVSRKIGFSEINPLAVFDVDADGRYEILVSGTNGHVGVYDSESLKPIWEREVSKAPLTGPVIGNFDGTGAYSISVAATDGRVYFLRAGDGDLLAVHESGKRYSLEPTVAPLKSGSDAVVLADDAGSIHVFALDAGAVKEIASVSNQWDDASSGLGTEQSLGRIAQPVTAADLTGDGAAEIISGTVSGAIQVFSVEAPERRSIFRVAQGTGIDTAVAAGDFFGTGVPQIAFATTKGDVVVLSVKQNEDGKLLFKEERKAKLSGRPTGHLIAQNVDGDAYLDLAGSSEEVVPVFGGASQLSSMGKMPYAITGDKISTALGAGARPGWKPLLLFVDKRQMLHVLDPTSPDQAADRVKLDYAMTGFFPVGDLTGKGNIEFLHFDKPSRKLVRFTLNVPSEPKAVPTMTYGVTFRRDGQWTNATATRLAGARERLNKRFEEVFAQAKQALSSGTLDEAARLALMARALKPTHSEVRSMVRGIEWRQHWVRNTAVGVALIGFVGAAGWTAQRQIRRRGRLARAERLLRSGQAEQSLIEYQSVLRQDPTNRTATLALAGLFAETGNIPPQGLETLRRARQMEPENTNYTLALARACAEADEESDEALDCYLVAIATLQSGRGRIAYHAANMIRRRGDMDQAIKYYKMALREGYTEPAAVDALADAFVETAQFSEKNLPVLEAAAPRRQDNARFLEGLCRSYAAARRADGAARKAAGRLLELSPDNLAALRLAGKCDFFAGKAPEAAVVGERALAADPADKETIEFVAQCYIAQRRTDNQAAAAYRNALKGEPERPDLLAALACCLVHGRAADAESYEIVRKAVDANPEDADLALGLAAMATGHSDHPTATRALERAAHLGRGGAEVWLPLATAYGALGDAADPVAAERAFREALKINPDDVSMLRHLGGLFTRLNRTEPEAMGTLERLLQKNALTHLLGKQLVRTYLANGRHDDAIRLVRSLAQHDRDDPDLQKLYAQASLASNRVDDAVSQYEDLYRRNPEDKEAVVNLAMAYAQKQRTDGVAAQVFQRALGLQAAGLGPVRLMLARHYAGEGRIDAAIQEYSRACELGAAIEARVRDDVRALVAASPDRADLRWYLARLLLSAGKADDALVHLQAILEIDPTQLGPLLEIYDGILSRDPNHAGANWQKGVLLKTQGHFEQARPLLELAHKLDASDPGIAGDLAELYEELLQEHDDVSVRFAQGRLYYSQQDFDHAIGCFQKTSQDFRYENESVKLLGLCFVAKGMLEFALQEFKKLPIDDEMKEVLYDLAQRYEEKNDIVGAKQVYRQLFAADINYRNVKAKFEMLAGNTSDPVTLEKTSLMTQLSEKARRRYELIEELGRGAMGIVYKAKDNELDELVALKILPDNLSHNPEALTRFKSEARSARRLAHPSIVRIHDIGEEMGRKYISMEFVEGGDLKRYLRERGGRLEPKEVARLMAPIASALDYAHSLHIVHRDIKPANIMLSTQGHVKVSDFGIAKMLEMTGETAAGAVIGTPLYMSPEQVQGLPVDNRADIYSFGIMMYEFASGRPPFTEGDLAYQHVRMPVKPIEGIPDVLQEIIMKCLAKEKEDRWRTAGEVYRALDRSGLLEE